MREIEHREEISRMVERLKDIAINYGEKAMAAIPVCVFALNSMEQALRADNNTPEKL